MEPVLISIIVPTYNRADLLPETLDSVLSQSYENWECIIVDDGSSDHTPEIAERYVQKDARFKFFQRPADRKSGGNGARNFGFLKSNGKYIKWLDSDDLIAKDLLQKEAQLLSHENPDLIVCSWIYFDSANTNFPERNRLVKAAPKNGMDLLNKMGELGEFTPPPSYLIKREIVYLAGLWNENLRNNQDGEFSFRFLNYCTSIKYIDTIGTIVRKDSAEKAMQKQKSGNMEARLKSWQCIEGMIAARENPQQLGAYIEGHQSILYHELKNTGNWKLILKFRDFFRKNIKLEKSRKAKAKLLFYRFQSFFS